VGLLYVDGSQVLLVRQYRYLVNQLAWEIPGGRIDPHESPEEGAVREGLEESGLRCRSIKPLLYFHPGLDTFDNPTFLFFCTDFESAQAENLHPQEVSERVWVPLARCVEMIFGREIEDSLTIIGLLAYQTIMNQPAQMR
jgi:8-oxo-dGTP pyrophosphatase MutT (NUDIX family)